MNAHDQMVKLMEAVDKVVPLDIDEPDEYYTNSPNEQTVDMKTMNDVGDDLNRVKDNQFNKPGDSAWAGSPVKVQNVKERLEKEYAEFLKEGEQVNENFGAEMAQEHPHIESEKEFMGILNGLVTAKLGDRYARGYMNDPDFIPDTMGEYKAAGGTLTDPGYMKR